MKRQTVDIEGNTLDDAREKAKSKIPSGFFIISERVVSEGKPQFAKGISESIDSAYSEAQSKLHQDAHIISRKVIQEPEDSFIRVEADNESLARNQVEKQVDETTSIKSITLATLGKKGFLGIGKTNNKYDVSILKLAVVEVTYILNARIEVTIVQTSDYEKQEINKLQRIVQQYAKPSNTSSEVVSLARLLPKDAAKTVVHKWRDVIHEYDIDIVDNSNVPLDPSYEHLSKSRELRRRVKSSIKPSIYAGFSQPVYYEIDINDEANSLLELYFPAGSLKGLIGGEACLRAQRTFLYDINDEGLITSTTSIGGLPYFHEYDKWILAFLAIMNASEVNYERQKLVSAEYAGKVALRQFL